MYNSYIYIVKPVLNLISHMTLSANRPLPLVSTICLRVFVASAFFQIQRWSLASKRKCFKRFLAVYQPLQSINPCSLSTLAVSRLASNALCLAVCLTSEPPSTGGSVRHDRVQRNPSIIQPSLLSKMVVQRPPQ